MIGLMIQTPEATVHDRSTMIPVHTTILQDLPAETDLAIRDREPRTGPTVHRVLPLPGIPIRRITVNPVMTITTPNAALNTARNVALNAAIGIIYVDSLFTSISLYH